MNIFAKTTNGKTLYCVPFACLFVASATAQQPGISADASRIPAVVIIFSCVDNTTGAMRIVGGTTACKSTEHKIHWNQQGPQGPQGPIGQQGPPGISVGLSSAISGGVILPAFPGVLVAQSAQVAPSGTYFISASALVDVEDSNGVFCCDTIASNGTPFQFGGSTLIGAQQASITDAIAVNAGDSFELWCSGSDNDTSEFLNAGLTAILINSASDASNRFQDSRTHRPTGSAKVR
jgi:hypothetical protein